MYTARNDGDINTMSSQEQNVKQCLSARSGLDCVEFKKEATKNHGTLELARWMEPNKGKLLSADV